MGESDAHQASAYSARPQVASNKTIPQRIAYWLLGVGDEFIQLVVLCAAAVLLFLPPILAVLGIGAGGVNCLLVLIQIGKAWRAEQYDVLFAALPLLAGAAELAFAGLAYLALLYSLSVLISGMIGHGRQRFFLLPGVILSLAAVIAYSTAAYLLTGMLDTMTAWGDLPFVILFGYLGLDAAVLGLLATDLRRSVRRPGTAVSDPVPTGRVRKRVTSHPSRVGISPRRRPLQSIFAGHAGDDGE
jgi:hypothetical protein